MDVRRVDAAGEDGIVRVVRREGRDNFSQECLSKIHKSVVMCKSVHVLPGMLPRPSRPKEGGAQDYPSLYAM